MKKITLFLLAVCATASTVVTLAIVPSCTSSAPAATYPMPEILAHRGFYTVEGSEENTLSSLENAQKLGIYGVEFDVNMTADGELIVFHGPKIGETLHAQNSTYDEISKVTLRNGHKIPTLRQWLEQGRKYPATKLVLEMKKHATPQRETEAAEKIVALCREEGMMEQMEFISFSLHACREFVRLAPECKVAYITTKLRTTVTPDELKADGIGGFSCDLNVYMNRPEMLDRANEIGVGSIVWMVENEEVVNWAIKHRATFICTDYPDRMKSYFDSKL